MRRSTVLALLLGVLVGLGLTLSAASVGGRAPVRWSRPAAGEQPAAPPPGSWSPQIAFQYYETSGIEAQYLAEHVDWLMLRYGAEELRDELRDAGYERPIPQYLLLFQIIGPGPLEDRRDDCEDDYTPLQNNVVYTRDFCALVHPNEEWFLHNDDGERLVTKERLWDGSEAYEYLMNPGSEGFREFWIAQVRGQGAAGWDALFLDNVAYSYAPMVGRADNGDSIAEYDSNADWQLAVAGMLRAIKAAFPERQLWGNIIETPHTGAAWAPFLPYLDGIQEERFATGWRGEPALTPEQWHGMLGRAEQALAAGKGVVLYGQGQQDDFARLRFALASYLLVASPDARASFRYTYTSHYEQLWWYPEYGYDLGLPAGPRYEQDGRWLRDFNCARVSVDPARQRGEIERLPCAAAEEGRP
jgi:hypothetical protein